MKAKIRDLIPNDLINYAKHLPTAVLANIKYGFPSNGMIVIGVSGTDGKTTTVNMLYQIFRAAGQKVSMISTVKAVINNQELDTGFHVTSPEPMDLQRYIRMAKDARTEVLILEVSSFALSQFRVWGIKFDVGVITNITHEHLDYHKTWENYFLAKAKLIKKSRIAVINRDESHFGRLKKMAEGRVVSFGFSKEASYNPSNTKIKLKMAGEFNILNGLAAWAVAENLGVDRKVIEETLTGCAAVAGRMNEIENDRGVRIFVDYAHTPNGLEQALTSLKKMARGNVIAVFGAEGDRDVGKRSMMGEVASRLADKLVVSAVDPRGQIEEINSQILKGVSQNINQVEGRVFVVNDRLEGIRLAINDLAKSGDVVGLFGKGHESSQNIDGKKELPWSDVAAVRQVLDEKQK